MAYIMNTLFNRVKEFFNIILGVSNQKDLNYKRCSPAGLLEDKVAGNKVTGVTEGHFAFNKLWLREESSCHRSKKYQVKQDGNAGSGRPSVVPKMSTTLSPGLLKRFPSMAKGTFQR